MDVTQEGDVQRVSGEFAAADPPIGPAATLTTLA